MSVGGFGSGGLGVVTDGLIFMVDAFNRKSYISGDTLTNDLMSSNLTGGTLVNGVTYDNYWTFDGSNQYIDFGDVLDMGTNDYTIEAWININNLTSNDWFVSKSRAAASAYRYGFGITNSNQLFSVVDGNPPTTPKTPIGNTSLDSNMWYMVSLIIDRDGEISYRINGQIETLTGDADISLWNGQDFNSTEAFRIGTYTAADGINITNPFDGSVSQVRIYNRVISISESLQNFKAIKSRVKGTLGDYVVIPSIPTANIVSDWNAENDVYTDAGVTLATNGQTVEEWHDQVSTIISSGTTDKPTYYTSGGLISKPYVDFDGSGDFMEVIGSNVLYTDQDITFYIVSEIDTSSLYDVMIQRGQDWNWEEGWVVSIDDNNGGMAATVGDWNVNEVTTNGGSPGNGQLNNLEVRSMRFQTSVSSGSRVINIRISDNNVGIGTDTQKTLTGDDINDAPNKNALIGAGYDGSGNPTQYFLDGRIYRLLIYNTYHDDTTYENTIQALLNEYQ